jgi:hypothetical protein
VGKPVAAMSNSEKIAEAMRRSMPLLPQDAQAVVKQMLSPASLAIIVATVVVWAGAQFFGVGEIVDVILLAVGALTIGFGVFEGGDELLQFAKGALGARSESDLDAAAGHFARAVVVLGVSAVQAVLMKGPARTVADRGLPEMKPPYEVDEPPPAGAPFRVARVDSLPDGNLGVTDAYGSIVISRDQSLSEQRITLYHELVHRYFSPRTGPLRKLRAEISTAGYQRSALLKYLEEALAEGYAQMRVNGLAAGLRAYKFPLAGDYPYVTISQLTGEGALIGTLMFGGSTFYVTISNQPWNRR